MAPDKQSLKIEYITTTISLRGLAKKYGINKDKICRWAKEEDWDRHRRQHQDETETAVLEKDRQGKTDRADALNAAADLLLKKVVKGMQDYEALPATAAKNYSDALKNIKEIHMIRTEEDIEEQKARIAKLHKEAEREDRNAAITVTLGGGIDGYAD